MATPADDDLLAMHRPSALMRGDDPPPSSLPTPKKRWMLMWRQQEQQPEMEMEKNEFHGSRQDKQLRVETPAVASDEASSSLSPLNANVNSAASISPSSKAKEGETAAASIMTQSRTPSPVKILQDKQQEEEEEGEEGEEGEEPESSVTAVPPLTVRTTSSSSSVSTATSTDSAFDDMEPKPAASGSVADPEKKRERPEDPHATQESGEINEIMEDGEEEAKPELTESERQRLERRKRRKTNWDVGDPRKHGGSVDLAALNLLSSINPPATHPASFAKFPRHRPAYRHSYSLDAPHQQRGTFFGNSTAVGSGGSLQSPPRRPFHQSHSLPLERTRSARSLPSAMRFPPGNR